MKLIKDVTKDPLPYHINITIRCERGQERAIDQLLETINPIDTSKDYDISIKPTKRKRSKDANAYMWTLIGKLGEILNKPDPEIYREYIKDNGVFEIMPVRKDAIKRWTKNWESRGVGWVCDDLGRCRDIEGYHYIKCYYGSSTYTTKEMARLIDAVVADCKEQGIETMTPAEIERLKAMWGDG